MEIATSVRIKRSAVPMFFVISPSSDLESRNIALAAQASAEGLPPDAQYQRRRAAPPAACSC